MVCGEKILGPHDLAVGHYWHELLHGFTHADGKLLKSLRAVLLRPGELSKAYMEGRRQFYMRPVNLFVVLNLVYFLVPMFEVFNTSLNSQLQMQPYSAMARNWVDTTLAATGATAEAYAQAFTLRSSSNAKLMLVLLVFILALPMALLYRGRTKWASGHVTFAFELMIFNLLALSIMLASVLYAVMGVAYLSGHPTHGVMNDGLISSIAFVLNLYFFFGAGRRFYGCTIPGALWRAVVAFPLFFIGLTTYRFLLFMVTHWQVGHALAT